MRTYKRSAVAAVSLALLVTACGAGEKSGDQGKDTGKGAGKDGAPSASATSAPAAELLSAAELEKLIVGQADLPGHQVQKAKAGEVPLAAAVSTDKPSCKPLADVMSYVAPGKPGATATRKAIEVPKTDGSAASPEEALGALAAPVTGVTLGSYDGQGAQETFASLKTAGTECAGGFTLIGGGEKTKISAVAPEPVTAGEEALAWTVTTDLDGRPFVTKVVVFRQGGTLASFSTLSFGGTVKALPKAIVDAQAAKLG
ncbi:Lipoprotein [Streptomyces venezuelae]|uniref:hypothetical protein n=1 Tax=Streptomyces gardneri TaxID=66892 RepID=UPI0006BD2AE9|nr:hypothetical protein [Streptomyces gardneri]ALO10453.1 Lipoprotein [Streptomyces venezuelae]QPK47455.1 hypothetical protein H4W23_24375 [Streptomyces gardneri]WRK38886.1 hypothetical protein U0M97_24480 [Streptomyces venezuelae]CUM39081.1 putative lipoprotein [Streptomyces venezuelae]